MQLLLELMLVALSLLTNQYGTCWQQVQRKRFVWTAFQIGKRQRKCNDHQKSSSDVSVAVNLFCIPHFGPKSYLYWSITPYAHPWLLFCLLETENIMYFMYCLVWVFFLLDIIPPSIVSVQFNCIKVTIGVLALELVL